MTQPGRHIMLTPTWLLKQWLLAFPILLCVLVAVLLAVADRPAAYLLVAGALVAGGVAGSIWLPMGEGRAAPLWLLTLPFWLLVFGGVVVPALALGLHRLFVLGSLAVGLMTWCSVAAFRIVRRRGVSWRSIVTAPWPGLRHGPREGS
jgi:hypothetical protein